MVILHLDNNTAKVCLCNQNGRASLFLSRLVCHILNLADMYGITPVTEYIPANLNAEANRLSYGRLIPEWDVPPHAAQAHFQLWGLLEVDLFASSHTNQCQHYYTLQNAIPLGA